MPILNRVKTFNQNKSSDVHGIPLKLIKITAHSLAEQFVLIFNISMLLFKTVYFLINLKLISSIKYAKIIKYQITLNYRPISILPLFSKLFEKLKHQRLIDYIIKY